MLALRHRESRDIDAFIDDGQYLGFLDPDLGAEGVWDCEASDRQSNYVKIFYPYGEIDFIAAGRVTDLAPTPIQIDGHEVWLQHPVEIAVSKMRHRPRTLKVRDIYDIAAVDQVDPQALAAKLHHLASRKADLEARLADVTPGYLAAELAEIDVLDGWAHLPGLAFECVSAIVDAIPEPADDPA